MKISILVFALLAFSSIPLVHASCVSYVPFSSEIRDFNEANTLFVGKVIDVYHPPKESVPGMQNDEFAFDVAYYLKGELKNNIVVSSHSSIGYDDFVKGQSYLVFAFGAINEVGQCSPPIVLSSAGPVLVLFYLWQYLAVIILAIIGGIIFAIWRNRK